MKGLTPQYFSMKRISNYIPLTVSAALLMLMLAVLLESALDYTKNTLVYATDDNYIFMAMAKNLALHGNWSADLKEFTSSSSSFTWLLLLGFSFLVFGVNVYIPLVLNISMALGLLAFCAYSFNKLGVNQLISTVALCAVVVFTPLYSVILAGQEHTLQALLTIAFIFFASDVESIKTKQNLLFLAVLAVLLTATRYEGLFLIAAVAVLYAIRKNYRKAFLLVLAGLVPVILYGVFSVSKDWYFLPNSIFLKGQFPEYGSASGIANMLGLTALKNLAANKQLLALLAASVMLLFILRKDKLAERERFLLTAFIMTELMHLQFARTGAYFRYEAYLIATGIFVVSVSTARAFAFFKENNPAIIKKAAVTTISIALMFVLGLRGVLAYEITPEAIMNIYHQQYQMGLFVKEYYNGRVVAANDIGAVNFLADVECVDLAGLASIEIAELMRAHSLSTDNIKRICKDRNTSIAIVYDHWFTQAGGLPAEWKQAGQWTIKWNVNVAGNTVTFYAVDPNELNALMHNLREFSSRLPADVIQSGPYTVKE